MNLAVKELGGAAQLTVAALTAVGAVIGKSLAVFAADEQAIFRTTVVLQNLRSSLPIAELQEFAQGLQRTIAIDDEAVVAVGGLLARFGVAGDQIPAALRSIVDASEATGQSLEEIGQAVGRAVLGQTRGLRALGIEFKATGNRARDLASIQAELDRRFGGAGEARRDTLAGSFQALAESFQNLFSAIGERLAPALIKILDLITSAVDFLTERFDELFQGFLSQFAGGTTLFRILGPQGNQAARVGRGAGSPATESTLQEVAEHTKQTAATVRQIQGGGALSRGALNIRGLNAALRAVR